MAGLLLPNLGLPFPTKFLASDAKPLGGFGLVRCGITILYHRAILGQTRGHIAFTKLDLRWNTQHTARRLCVM